MLYEKRKNAEEKAGETHPKSTRLTHYTVVLLFSSALWVSVQLHFSSRATRFSGTTQMLNILSHCPSRAII